MAVYYKFKSAKDFDSIPIDGHFISVANLKERIFESKLGKGPGFDLVVSNAQTNEEYLDEATLIPKNTSLLVRRVPIQRRMTIVTNREEPKVVENNVEHEQLAKTSVSMETSGYPNETEWDVFGNDLYAIPEVMPIQSNNMVQDNSTCDKADEDNKIKALIDSSAFDWQTQPQDGFGAGRGFGRGMGGRMIAGRGFGRGGGFERKTPPQGYICHRCEVPGHFIQHCPTNGDPNYDKKRVKNPTGIPRSMLEANPEGAYALPGGAVAMLKPNEAAFDREVEGLSSTRSVGELPPELHCPLCKEVMKDAVLTSKCCFSSFCDKCIRNCIISKSMCVCGATNILADDLLPNKTVRDTINRILESNNSSADNAGSAVHIQESSRCEHPKVPSPTISATSKGGQMPPSPKKDTLDLKEATNSGQPVVNAPKQSLETGRPLKAVDLSEVTRESMFEKEPKLQGGVVHAEEEVQQKLSTSEPGKKKKKKKMPFPANAAELQWRPPQDYAAENYMMPFAQPTFDPYWSGMQYGMDGYMAPPYPGAMPYMGYAPGPFGMPPPGVFPQDPFGGQGYSMPAVPPQRDLSGFGMGFNPASSNMSREEFEARKADLKRKREDERRGQRESFKDWESGRELSNHVDVSSMKSKSRNTPQETELKNQINGTSNLRERPPREAESTRHSQNKAEQHLDDHKASVFSRISFPEGGKKKKPSSLSSTEIIKSSSHQSHLSNGYKESTAHHRPSSTRHRNEDHREDTAHHRPSSTRHRDEDHREERKSTSKAGEVGASSKGGRKSMMVMDRDSSEDEEEERHFKRRPARYEPQPMEWEEDANARDVKISSRERDRDRGRDHHERDYERQRGHRHSSHR
ncbi:hypothetical protein AQUCO_04900203v1 [Aquilegia coerulea]|uniref:DWNN domain-containing protein n=1 Tax=Aquilegia coerulea TaxID=218851 RepID=A0A2G5CKG6_AQUCA|nr:hypothetical protein AQUCO_04900203v1 [Aquilegia coerulea]